MSQLTKKVIVSFKNFLINESGSKQRISDLDTFAQFQTFIKDCNVIKYNTQWLSEKNRDKINAFKQEAETKKLDIKFETINLAPIDESLTKHYKAMIEFVPKKQETIEIDAKDIEIIKGMVTKYNKTSVKKLLRNL